MQERIRAEREGQPFLLLRDGAQTQHIVRLPADGDRLTIGRGAVVGTGAAVIKDVAAGSTVVGVPARPRNA